ncbi:hypothetical protein OCU04_004429 [Sclerotinia nivalis]|uniref:Uncharacterized protein n=1 Tax=Sclerotinia nivalis TaxID=352851 RepID=A0A9X0AQH0_9HELO|nr:hypothetical protein OCU04_004429 [Sclerotinia nivalis]
MLETESATNNKGLQCATVNIDKTPKEPVIAVTYALTVRIFLEWLMETEEQSHPLEIGTQAEK